MNYRSRNLLARILLPMEGDLNEEMDVFSIESKTVADLISKQRKLLILDCRPFLAFSDGHITGAVNVHCPSILRRRLRGQILPLRTLIPEDDVRNKLLNHNNDSFDKVILYDDKSCDLDSTEDSMLKLVSKCLQFEGRRFSVYYLNGGFRRFRQNYPQLSSIKSASTPSFGTNYLDKQIISSVLKNNNSNGQSIDCPVEVIPHLFLGSATHASKKETLKRSGITALLNVSPRTCPNYFEGVFSYKSIDVDDNISADLGSWFPEAISFIDSVMDVGGSVLVHCHAGISRSATICLAYLMSKYRLHLDQAFDLVRAKRSVISPNFGFMDQLLQFESQVFSASPRPSHIQPSATSSSSDNHLNLDSEPRPSSLPSNLSPCQQVFTFDFTTSCPVLSSSSSMFNSFCSTPRTILSPS